MYVQHHILGIRGKFSQFFRQFFRQAQARNFRKKIMGKIIERGNLILNIQLNLFPALRAFWFQEKTALHENPVSQTVLMIQPTRNSPTCAYIGQNQRKWKPCYGGTRCIINCSPKNPIPNYQWVPIKYIPISVW